MTREKLLEKLHDLAFLASCDIDNVNLNEFEDLVLEWNSNHPNDEIFVSTCFKKHGDAYNAIMVEDDVYEINDDDVDFWPEW